MDTAISIPLGLTTADKKIAMGVSTIESATINMRDRDHNAAIANAKPKNIALMSNPAIRIT
jgi:hypothetical protein